MRTARRVAAFGRVLSPQEFEALLQRAEISQKLQKLRGPKLLGKTRVSLKRSASPRGPKVLTVTLPFAL